MLASFPYKRLWRSVNYVMWVPLTKTNADSPMDLGPLIKALHQRELRCAFVFELIERKELVIFRSKRSQQRCSDLSQNSDW